MRKRFARHELLHIRQEPKKHLLSVTALASQIVIIINHYWFLGVPEEVAPQVWQTGTTLSSGWSTGRIPINGVGICFSQAFTLPFSGTYYFGDLDFYNLTNMRDVIVISAAASQ